MDDGTKKKQKMQRGEKRKVDRSFRNMDLAHRPRRSRKGRENEGHSAVLFPLSLLLPRFLPLIFLRDFFLRPRGTKKGVGRVRERKETFSEAGEQPSFALRREKRKKEKR